MAPEVTTDELAQQFSELAELSGDERRAALAEMPPERRQLLQEYNKKARDCPVSGWFTACAVVCARAWPGMRPTPIIARPCAQIARGMADINMMLKLLKPLDGAPDEPVHTVAVLASLACCPGMAPIGGDAEPDHLQALEAAVVQHAAETDSNAYRDVHDKIPPAARNTLLLLLWLLYQAKLDQADFRLEGDLDERCEVASKVAIRILVQAQRAVVGMSWVQPTLALYRTSALLGNGLWSGSDPLCASRMRTILASDQLTFPDVSVRVHAHAGLTTNGSPDRMPFLPMEELAATPPGRLLPSQPVYLEVELTRAHAREALDGVALAGGPPSVLEAYWLVVEGIKPDPEPNSMVHHQPMIVSSVTTQHVRARVRFAAPPPGEYCLRVHVLSSSVAGVEMHKEVGFTVEEDDVPELS